TRAVPRPPPPRASMRRFHDCLVVCVPWERSETPRRPRTATEAKPTIIVTTATTPNHVIAAPGSVALSLPKGYLSRSAPTIRATEDPRPLEPGRQAREDLAREDRRAVRPVRHHMA